MPAYAVLVPTKLKRPDLFSYIMLKIPALNGGFLAFPIVFLTFRVSFYRLTGCITLQHGFARHMCRCKEADQSRCPEQSQLLSAE